MTEFLRVRPVLAVQDLERSRRLYTDILGLNEDSIGAPGWVFLSKDAFYHVLGGQRASPPEDCGGPPGYLRLLEALADPTNPDHAQGHH